MCTLRRRITKSPKATGDETIQILIVVEANAQSVGPTNSRRIISSSFSPSPCYTYIDDIFNGGTTWSKRLHCSRGLPIPLDPTKNDSIFPLFLFPLSILSCTTHNSIEVKMTTANVKETYSHNTVWKLYLREQMSALLDEIPSTSQRLKKIVGNWRDATVRRHTPRSLSGLPWQQGQVRLPRDSMSSSKRNSPPRRRTGNCLWESRYPFHFTALEEDWEGNTHDSNGCTVWWRYHPKTWSKTKTSHNRWLLWICQGGLPTSHKVCTIRRSITSTLMNSSNVHYFGFYMKIG